MDSLQFGKNMSSPLKSTDNIAMIILAAGRSERMGRPKQLLKWNQTTLLGNAIEQAMLSDVTEISVVLGYLYNQIKSTVEKYKINILHNVNWEKGMGTSIQCAMDTVLGKSFDAVIITLADLPFLTYHDYNTLINAYKKNTFHIISTRNKNKPGVPALFSKRYFKDLYNLDQDYGARYIIQKFIKDNYSLKLPSSNYDIDTIEDYSYFLSIQQKE